MILSLFISIGLFLGSGDLEKAVNEYLKDKLAAYDKYEYEIKNIPDGDIKINYDTQFKLSGNFIYIPIDYYNKNIIKSKSYLTVKVKLFKNVLVAAVNINNGTVLDSTMVEKELKDVTNLHGMVLLSNGEISGMKSKIFIRKGTALVKEFLEREPIINRGDIVTVISRSGNVIISTKAEAEQKGNIGQLIKILTKDKKQLKAEIIDANNVLLKE